MMNLLKKLKNAFEIPFDPSDEQSNRDAIVSGLLNVAIAIAGIYLTPLTLERGIFSIQVLIAWVTIFVIIALRIVVGKGHARTVSLALLLVFWIAATMAAKLPGPWQE